MFSMIFYNLKNWLQALREGGARVCSYPHPPPPKPKAPEVHFLVDQRILKQSELPKRVLTFV